MRVDVRLNRLGEMRAKTRQRSGERVRRGLDRLAQEVRTESPVDTGFMRDHVTPRMLGEQDGEVHVEAPYSGFVNYGTRHQAANPFADRAAARVADEFPGMFLGLLD